ncbi:hypothetical protein OIU93_19800 [Paeniglutamicibacter sp. ZC-3]|uniref:hypothetical protein n=1 Tax=Paeniglutamicibacter sp. ZC-3 TaxID=2986919 RepID=UPI0021F6F082|nr:hypothetical protein [Paeniglutamicibacter sp. ZC-3]MCV9996514.1 hypothetical protein [Paeniglutamicibacter sp. ZC-3]
MPDDIVVIETIKVASPAPSWRVEGVVDGGPAEIELDGIAAKGFEYLGRTHTALQRIAYVTFGIGISSIGARGKLAATFEGAGWIPGIFIHPTLVIGSKSEIKKGTVL